MTKNRFVNKRLVRIRVIYSCVAMIVLLCVGLFFMDVITAEDTEQIEHIASRQYGKRDLVFVITDLHSNQDLYDNSAELVLDNQDVKVFSKVNRFDVRVGIDADTFEHWGKIYWVMLLQGLSVLMLVSLVVLTGIVLVSFYRNLKRDKVFMSKNIKVIRWIGILLISMSLMADASSYIERMLAFDLLRGTGWESDVVLSIHFMRIFFGLVIIMLAEIFYVGYDIQEEQKLII